MRRFRERKTGEIEDERDIAEQSDAKRHNVTERQRQSKNNNGVVPADSQDPEMLPLIAEFRKRYLVEIPEDFESKYPDDFEKCVCHMLQLTEDGAGEIQNPIGYLTQLLKSPDTAPDSDGRTLDERGYEEYVEEMKRTNSLLPFEQRMSKCLQIVQ